MRGLMVRIIAWVLLLSAAVLRFGEPVQAQAQPGENIFGLLVINQSYQDGFAELSSVETNLSGAYRLFQTLNVPVQNVKLLLGGGPSEIEDALFSMGEDMPENSQLIIYYYGLGITESAEGTNLAVLPGLSLLETSEPRIVTRRLRRSTLPLATLARDLEFTPAEQKLIIYDACSVPALTGGDGALYWQKIEKTPCLPQEIAGADVIFGAPDVPQSSLLEALTAVLASDPAQTLSSLQQNLQAEFEANFGLPADAPLLVQADPDFETAERCFFSSDAESGLCTVVATPEPAPVAEVEPEPESESATSPTDTDEVVVENESNPETEDVEAAAETPKSEEPEDSDPLLQARTGTGDAQQMQSDWNEARTANSCDGFTNFLLNYPTSPFALKAQFSLRRVCSQDQLAAFEEAKAEAETARAEEAVADPDPEPASVETNEPEADTQTATDEGDVEDAEEPIAEAEAKEGPAPLSESATQAVSVREAWLNAKATNTCEAYLAFERDYPGSPFALKSKFEANRACTDADRAAFAEAAGAATDEEPEAEASEQTELASEGEEENDADVPKPEDNTHVETQEAEAEPVEATNERIAEDDTEEQEPEAAPEKEQPELQLPDSRTAWLSVRDQNTCYGYLAFARDYPDSFQKLRAEQASRIFCSTAQSAAFEAGNLQPDDTIAEPEEPKEEDIEIAAVDPTDQPGDQPEEENLPEVPEEENLPEVPEEEPTPEEGSEEGDDNAPTEVTDEQTEPATEAVEEIERKPAYAFLVVNDAYESDEIANLSADADLQAFQDLIQELGIPEDRTKLLRNADRIQVEEEAFTFALDMEPGSNLLVYYAGHSLSMLDSKDILIVPSSFQIPQTLQVRLAKRRIDENTIRLRDLLRDLREGSPDLVTLIYNGCGQIPLQGDDVEPYWEFTNRNACDGRAIPGSSILFPVKPDQTAPETGDAVSPFMQVLLETIRKDPFVDLTELARTLVWEVPQINPDTVPVLLNDPDLREEQLEARCFSPSLVEDGEVCEKIEPEPVIIPVITVDPIDIPTEPVGRDEEPPVDEDPAVTLAYRLATLVYTCEVFQDFLNVYPETSFTERAQESIAELCEPVEPDPDAKVDEDWALIKDLDTCQLYEAFLEANPDSKYSDEAKEKIEALCQPEVAARPEYCSPDGDDPDQAALTREGDRLMQQRLNELGCDVGVVDGAWGRGSQRGFDRFVAESGVSWTETRPVCGTVARIQAYPDGRVCPLVCRSGFRVENGACVRIPTRNATTTSSNSGGSSSSSSSSGSSTSRTASQPPAAAPPTNSGGGCNAFQRRTADGRCVTKGLGPTR